MRASSICVCVWRFLSVFLRTHIYHFVMFRGAFFRFVAVVDRIHFYFFCLFLVMLKSPDGRTNFHSAAIK